MCPCGGSPRSSLSGAHVRAHWLLLRRAEGAPPRRHGRSSGLGNWWMEFRLAPSPADLALFLGSSSICSIAVSAINSWCRYMLVSLLVLDAPPLELGYPFRLVWPTLIGKYDWTIFVECATNKRVHRATSGRFNSYIGKV